MIHIGTIIKAAGIRAAKELATDVGTSFGILIVRFFSLHTLKISTAKIDIIIAVNIPDPPKLDNDNIQPLGSIFNGTFVSKNAASPKLPPDKGSSLYDFARLYAIPKDAYKAIMPILKRYGNII